MLQVALGGYFLAEDGVTEYYDTPVYYEPQFTTMQPLEIGVSQADRFYILIRKRADTTGTSFEAISIADLTITVTDVTVNESIPAYVRSVDLHAEWSNEPSSYTPLVGVVENAIDPANPIVRVRAMDCFIKDTTDKDFITFRILVDDSDKYFHYIPVVTNNVAGRPQNTAMTRQAYVTVNKDADSYVLFSPYAYLAETIEDKSEFSYPLNSVFYKRQKTYNDEEFDFSIGTYSHSFVVDAISVMSAPGYEKAGILLIDNYMYTHLEENDTIAYVNITVRGKISGLLDTFQINFIR